MAHMIHRYLRRNRTRFVNQLKTLVAFPSVSAQPAHHRDVLACADWVAKHFHQIGLKTIVHKTKGNPIIVARSQHSTAPSLQHSVIPTVLIYGHYDVQPPEPFELWTTPPFKPTVRSGSLFGRGASDNKGQFFAHVKAVESYLKTHTPLPVNVIFLIEGEEEVGSEALMSFVKRHARQ